MKTCLQFSPLGPQLQKSSNFPKIPRYSRNPGWRIQISCLFPPIPILGIFQLDFLDIQGILRKRPDFLNYLVQKSATHVVKLTILQILDFGDVIYKIASNNLLNKLDAVYHSAIRFVTKVPYTTHHCTCTLSLAGPRFILVAKPTGSRSSTRPC